MLYSAGRLQRSNFGVQTNKGKLKGETITMQSANLLEFGTGGGGFIGQDKDVVINNVKFAEYSFQSKDRNTGTVTQTYEPSCVLQFDIEVLEPEDDDHRYVTQYLPVGSLPVSRLQELGWDVDMTKRKGGPGGYLPSADNENPSPEGPFVILEQKRDIWNQSDYAMFMTELINLGLSQFGDRISAQGVAALNGTKLHLVSKAKPKKNATDKDRTLLVASEVLSWGWEQQAAAPAKSAAKKAAAPKNTAAKPAPAAEAPAAEEQTDDAVDVVETRAIEVIQTIIAAGPVEHKALGAKAFALTSKDGSNRTPIMQRAVNKEFLASMSGMLWNWDAATDTVSPL
jgi:hypothetical protein